MALPTRWTWVWVNSGSWWWTGRPGVLRFMVSQSWTWLSDWTELNREDSILKNIDITLPTKVCLVKAIVFSIVMYRCESWTIKKAEHQRIDAFELWCWKRFLRVPWTARRSNQSTLKEITLLIVTFVVQELLSLVRSHSFIYFFLSITLGGGS